MCVLQDARGELYATARMEFVAEVCTVVAESRSVECVEALALGMMQDGHDSPWQQVNEGAEVTVAGVAVAVQAKADSDCK